MIAALLLGGWVLGGSAPLPVVPAPVDYADPAHWICRPGVDDGTCSAGLDATVIAVDGKRSRAVHVPAKKPEIDCFYVYPTSSLDPALLSDLRPDEERQSVHDQAARFGAGCRLFAPVYHQLTIAALKRAMEVSGDPAHINLDLDVPYRDIRAAWRYYLEHDNHGRGVVLIGHSQGSLLLTRLIAGEIEGHAAQHRLVAAYLAGSLTMDSGTFKTIEPCRTANQTGCVIAWSAYADDYHGPRLFGRASARQRPVCVDPGRLDDGGGTIKAYVRKPASAPENDPPYILVTDRIRARCVTDLDGAALRISVLPGTDASWIGAALPRSRAGASWDLHPHDIDLVQGNLLDLMSSETATWLARSRPAPAPRR